MNRESENDARNTSKLTFRSPSQSQTRHKYDNRNNHGNRIKVDPTGQASAVIEGPKIRAYLLNEKPKDAVTRELREQLDVAKQSSREAQDELNKLRCLVSDQQKQLDDYRNKYLEAQQTVKEQKRQIDLMKRENQRIDEQVNLEIQRVKNQFQEILQELMPLPDILKATQTKLQETIARELQMYKDKVAAMVGQIDDVKGKSAVEAETVCRVKCEALEMEEPDEVGSPHATTIKPEDDEIGITLENLRKTQKKDNDLRVVREWLKNGVRPTWPEIAKYSETIKDYWTQWDSLYLHDGLLHRKWESPDGVLVRQVVLPKSQVRTVLEELHSSRSGGHFGTERTLARVRKRFYWVNCRRDVKDWCQECDLCYGKN